MKTITLNSLSQLPSAAKAILLFANTKNIFCFYGELGAGKTTLIKEICKQLGVKDAGSSPTFSLVNEYKTATPALKGEKTIIPPLGVGGEILYHFDLYRLKDVSEVYDIGYEDYLFSGNYCFIEWPEKIESLLPEEHLKVSIEVKGGQRIISIS